MEAMLDWISADLGPWSAAAQVDPGSSATLEVSVLAFAWE